MKKITLIVLMLFTALSYAQVGINIATPHTSSALDITSTTGGLLVPRMTEVQRDDINSPSNPAIGLMIYQTDGATGFYYYNGSSWEGYYSKVEVDALIANLQSKTEARVGDIRAGGVVFWVDPSDNRHGLIAATEDQSSGIWWYNGRFETTFGSTGTAIGTGSTNTDAIIAVQGVTETSYAAGLARTYTGGGYTDWFLPSKDELQKMYLNIGQGNILGLGNIGNFANNYYWSSTEVDSDTAWMQDFWFESQTTVDKHYQTPSVRAVRAF